eukprot:1800620-Pyramimonas_sp.AAC.1
MLLRDQLLASCGHAYDVVYGERWWVRMLIGVPLWGLCRDVERAAKSDASATPLHVAAEEGQLDAVGLH